MKRKAVGCFLALGVAAFVAGGCATQQAVKKEEPLASTGNAVTTTPKKEATPMKPEKQATQSTVTGNTGESAANTASRQEALKAALDKVFFNFDSAELDGTARESLTRNAAFMKKNAKAKVRIEGNCDERGSEEYNLALGEKRAKASKQYLVTMGIPSERLSVISYGKEKPADPGHDDAAWAKNRRDDFVILNGK